MSFADLIFEELRRRNISLRKLAELADVDVSTLSKIINDGARPSTTTVRKLAPLLGRDEDELLFITGHRSERPAPARPQPLMPFAIPVYDMWVSAGKGEPHIQQYLYLGPDEGIPAHWFGIPVRGECMIPWLFPGDIVVVNPDAVPRDRDIVVFDLEHEKALVKWYRKGKRGDRFVPEHGDPIPFDEEKTRVVGVVMRTWRDQRRQSFREMRQAMDRHYLPRPEDEGDESDVEE